MARRRETGVTEGEPQLYFFQRVTFVYVVLWLLLWILPAGADCRYRP